MSRNPGSGKSGKSFSVLIGSNFRRFFSRIGLYQRGCRFLTVWGLEPRVKAWKQLVRQVMYEFDLNTPALAAYLDRPLTEMQALISRSKEEPPFGLVLDFCFVFNKDPLVIYPELIWMRDLWMQEFKSNVKAAQTALVESDIGTLTDVLHALEVSTALWADPLLAAPSNELLMVRESDFTERYADLVWTQLAKNKQYRGYAYQEAAKLRQQLMDDVKRRRMLYEQQEQAQKLKNRSSASSANKQRSD